MKQAPCLVIARIAPRERGDRTVRAELFLPHDQVNPGRIAVWDGCHSEASLDYYWSTKAPRKPAEREAAALVVQQYRNFMASIPAEDRQPIEERTRVPHNWRAHAWR